MLDYILSKLNILIMVTAIFAIGTYFAFYLAQSLEKQQADTVLNQISDEVYGVLTSQSICHEVTLTLPAYINTLGRSDTGNKLYYLFQANDIEAAQTSGGESINALVFSIRNKRTHQIISAEQIPTTADIVLFKWVSALTPSISIAQNDTDGKICGASGQTCTVLNPVAQPPSENAIKIVKEVYQGKTTILVIPCSTGRSWCEANYQAAVKLMKEKRGGYFNCEPCNQWVTNTDGTEHEVYECID